MVLAEYTHNIYIYNHNIYMNSDHNVLFSNSRGEYMYKKKIGKCKQHRSQS